MLIEDLTPIPSQSPVSGLQSSVSSRRVAHLVTPKALLGGNPGHFSNYNLASPAVAYGFSTGVMRHPVFTVPGLQPGAWRLKTGD